MGVEQRRYPRIPFTEPGQLEVPRSHANPGAGTVTVEARFKDISCQGAELVVSPADGARLIPGTIVTLRFSADGTPLDIPARVVWAAADKVGLRLRLGQLPADDKRAYADWIVPLTNRAIAQARAAAER